MMNFQYTTAYGRLSRKCAIIITHSRRKLYMVDERMKAVSDHTIKNTKARFIEKDRCVVCWMHNSLCICEKARNLAISCPPITINIALLMHYKEFGRASNTGKLLQLIAPNKSTMTIFGSDDETILHNYLLNNPSLLLYPGANSTPASEFKEYCQTNSNNVTLCVMDSTWNLSKAMERAIPQEIPRVNIDHEVSGPSLFISRKQSTTASKVSTIEAIYLALSGLGEDPAALEPFIPALKLAVDAVQKQRGRPNVYGNDVMATSD